MTGWTVAKSIPSCIFNIDTSEPAPMISSVAKWGNSLALRIPSAFAREIGVGEGVSVDISVADGALVVRPTAEAHIYDLDALLSGVTEANRHAEISTGPARGNEF
jgi:antitoxin MazE